MALDPNLYIHESDKAALDTLKAIPGFTPLIRSLMKSWNENQFRILNMSSRLRLSEEQLPRYYEMLGPICQKLGIEVPELYLELNVTPNAYTYGDTNPFIVVTSGLLESLPEELIPTVLAHECGHIACHHTLYRTMGQMILGGTMAIPGAGTLISLPLKTAFAYWMRCSEYSADRAAILCDGSAENVIEMCMRLSGYIKTIPDEASKEGFLSQAAEYRQMINDSKWNQTMEFMILASQSHPLTAVRAYEAREWAQSEDVSHLFTYMKETESGGHHTSIPLSQSASSFLGKDHLIIKERLEQDGFVNIKSVRSYEGTGTPGSVTDISIGGIHDIAEHTWVSCDAPVILTYYEPLSLEELRTLYPDQVFTPFSSAGCTGKGAEEVIQAFEGAGFTNLIPIRYEGNRPFLAREGSVRAVRIADQDSFQENTGFKAEEPVRIIFY
ncbi:MAG: M48 family metallopeptidase [Solobacterium sp.]|nr:M48 family metallopeptidase [Solobacterium sp.]